MKEKLKKLILLKQKKKTIEKEIKELEKQLFEADFKEEEIDGNVVKATVRSSFKLKVNIDEFKKLDGATDFIEEKVSNLQKVYEKFPNVVEKKLVKYITVKPIKKIEVKNTDKFDDLIDNVVSDSF